MAGALGLVATGGHFHSAPVPNIKVTGTIPSPLSNGILTTTASFTASGGTAPYQFGTTGNLPPGMNIAGNSGIVAGIPTTLGSYTFSVIAIDANGYIGSTSFTIVVAPYLRDTYYLYTTLLINGETNSGTNYIADASTNNFALTVTGSATPNRFNPLWGNGYYGNYLDGASGTISIPNSTAIILNTGAVPTFTIELWFNSNTLSNNLIDKGSQAGVSVPCYRISCGTSISFLWGDGGGVNYSQYTTSGITINPNTWYHVAVVSNAGALNIYVNGVSYATGTLPSYGDNGDPLFIGSRHDGDQFYQGYISNLRIVKGTAVYTSNFTPSTTPLTAIANTALLTCQSANFVDNSTNAFTLTPTGTVTVVPNQPFGALPSGVQNYGSSLFDGSTGYLTTPLTFSYASNFTIECWFNTNTTTTYACLYSDENGTIGATLLLNNNAANGQITFYGGTVSNFASTSTGLNNGAWHHVALTRSSTNLYLFIDGVLQNTTTVSGTFATSGGLTRIGNSYYSSRYFGGYISNFRMVSGTAVYTSNFTPPTTPLTAIANTSLLTLQNKNGANNNTFYDDGQYNYSVGTIAGNPAQGTFTPFSQTGWSNYFDGSTGGINTPVNPTALQLGSNNFTIEAWINLSTTPSNFNIIFGCESVTYDGILFGISTSNTIQINISSNGSTYNLFNGSTFATVIKTNTWTHVALIRNNGTLYAYINGVQDSTTYNISTNSIYFNSVAVGAIGIRPPTQSLYFPGYISNLRVVNGTAVYTSNFTPSTTPLTAIANTALLTCQSNRFIDNSTNAFTLTPSGTVQVQAFSPFAPGVSYSSANNGGSIYFNGSSKIGLPVSRNWYFGQYSGTFTIECWLYQTASPGSGNNCRLLMTGPNNNSTSLVVLSISPTNTVGIGLPYSATGCVTSGTFNNNCWNHIAICSNAWTVSIYINGVLAGGPTAITAQGLYAGNNDFEIGYDTVGTVNAAYTGYMSGLRITTNQVVYSGAFTPPTAPPNPTANTLVLLSGTNTGVQDATGKNDIITVGSAMTQSNTVKYGTGALYFNGSTSYAYLPPNNLYSFGLGDFTIEAWVNLGATSSIQPVCQSDIVGVSTNNKWFFSYTSSTLVFNTHASGGFTNSIPWTPTIGTWYHVAVTRASGTMKMFINGVSGTVTTTGTPSGYSLSQNGISVGGMSTPYYLTGYIDDLRITNGVARYTANFTPPTVPDLTL